MLGLAPLSSGVPSVQLSLYQSRLQQARQKAQQAEGEVKSLEAQASQARQSLSEAKQELQSVERQAPASPTTPQKSSTPERLNTQGQPVGRLIHLIA